MNYVKQARKLNDNEKYLINILQAIDLTLKNSRDITEENARWIMIKKETIKQLKDLGFSDKEIQQQTGGKENE